MVHPLPLTPDGTLLLRVGFEIAYDCPQPTPMILALNIHYSRSGDLVQPDLLITRPAVAAQSYRDLFGNWCSRIVAPAGKFVLTADALVRDAGLVDTQAPWAQQVPVEHLPEETLVFLLGSRYCETDQLAEIAWKHFGNGPTGWQRVQRFATLCTDTSNLVTTTRGEPVQLGRRTTKGRVCAGTSRIWPSPFAAA
jgi:hypothetical protein